MTCEELQRIAAAHGPSFYLLDTRQFRENYERLLAAMRAYYPKAAIAYSYKTNYTPRLCALVNMLGGWAEVVSDMEYGIAKRLGIPAKRVIFNGPWKAPGTVEELVLGGGIVNLDSEYDLTLLRDLAERYPKREIAAGIRCNFDCGDGVVSRFGFDVDSPAFSDALAFFRDTPNARLRGLHLHFAARALEPWRARVSGMLRLIERLGVAESVDYIDMGGALFGNMPESLRAQFDSAIPTYDEYAEVIAKPFAAFFAGKANRPILFIEPGSALAGDVMRFAAPVVSIKSVRGKEIATVLGSIYNINPTLNKKNPPLEVVSASAAPLRRDLDFGGFTCIESDYIYRHYDGPLQVGDYALFGNAGSYSVVLKPPFILPNFPILERAEDGALTVVKRGEVFDDLFRTYVFDDEKR